MLLNGGGHSLRFERTAYPNDGITTPIRISSRTGAGKELYIPASQLASTKSLGMHQRKTGALASIRSRHIAAAIFGCSKLATNILYKQHLTICRILIADVSSATNDSQY